MKTRFAILLALLVGCGAVQARTEGDLDQGMVNPGHIEHPAWFKNSFLDIREDIDEAARARKRVMLYFYQDGCPYCRKLMQDNFGQRQITEYARRHFDAVAINMWGDREVTGLDGATMTEKQFAESLRVMFTPTLLFMDEAGNVALRVNGYYHPHKFRAAMRYVATRRNGHISFRDYYGEQMSVRSSGVLHQEDSFMKPPYDLRASVRKSGKPLLVLFEQRLCLRCDELHGDIMQRPETRELMQKLDIALFDMWSNTHLITPDGRTLNARDWASELNIQHGPSMVFFDDSGKEIFRTEAYLRAFHTQSVMDYVVSGAYREQPSLQRFIDARADALRAKGVEVDLWK